MWPRPEDDIDPLDLVSIDDVLEHGDPGKWEFVDEKRGGGVEATSPLVMDHENKYKMMFLFKDEHGEIIELHYFRGDDGSVENVKVKPRYRGRGSR